jgi:protein AroM
MKTIAAITIGQSPRREVIDEMRRFLPGVWWTEAGALDGLDAAGITKLAPADGEFPLVTRLRDGGTAVVGERAVTPLMQRAVDRLAPSADVVLVLCSGRFDLSSPRPLVFPGLLLGGVARALFAGRRVLVLTPHQAQVDSQTAHWRARGLDPVVRWASPYGDADFGAVGREAASSGVVAAVFDCIGYGLRMQAEFAAASGLPSLLVRSVAARIVAELLRIPGGLPG